MGRQSKPAPPTRLELMGRIEAEVATLEEGDSQTAFDAARRLVNLGSKTATRLLMRTAVHGRQMHSRKFAIFALRLLEDPRSLRTLISLLGNGNPEVVRDEAAEALAPFVRRYAKTVVIPLLSACRDPAASVRWSAAYSLGYSNDARAIPVLESLLADNEAPPGNTPVKDEALEALQEVRARLANSEGHVVIRPGN